ncbi:MAG: DUF4241 domain-containing protein [Brevundimonas sp.]
MFRSILAALGLLALSAPAAQAQITPRPEVLTGAFSPGFVGEADDERYPIRVVRLGEVHISSGRVILVDPFVMSTRDMPLALTVRPGRYPVDLAVADAGDSGQRVALARMLISEEPPVRWTLAVTGDQDPTTLSGDDIFGYGVDSGTGAFVDAAVPAWLATEYPASDIDRYGALVDDWQARGEAAAVELGIPYGFALIEPLGPGSAAMFSSGWGDGYYASWVGYGADDRPVVIVTDFAVITAVNFPPATDSR